MKRFCGSSFFILWAENRQHEIEQRKVEGLRLHDPQGPGSGAAFDHTVALIAEIQFQKLSNFRCSSPSSPERNLYPNSLFSSALRNSDAVSSSSMTKPLCRSRSRI